MEFTYPPKITLSVGHNYGDYFIENYHMVSLYGIYTFVPAVGSEYYGIKMWYLH